MHKYPFVACMHVGELTFLLCCKRRPVVLVLPTLLLGKGAKDLCWVWLVGGVFSRAIVAFLLPYHTLIVGITSFRFKLGLNSY